MIPFPVPDHSMGQVSAVQFVVAAKGIGGADPRRADQDVRVVQVLRIHLVAFKT